MGKLERLHRTLQVELLQGRRFLGFESAQTGFDIWRRHDNHDARTRPSTGASRAAAI